MNIVISGGARGIGKSVAEKFAAEGHTLFICARSIINLEATAIGLRKSFPNCNVLTMVADLSHQNQAKAFGEFCLQKGAPDILVNNAGMYAPGNIADEAEGSIEAMIANNLYSAYYLTRALLPAMKQNSRGRIFNICSVASLAAYAGGGSYSISKYALNGFSKNLRLELTASGIGVTAIFPGAVFTDSWGDFDNSGARIMEANDVAEMILAATKLSPQAVPEEIILRPQQGDL